MYVQCIYAIILRLPFPFFFFFFGVEGGGPEGSPRASYFCAHMAYIRLHTYISDFPSQKGRLKAFYVPGGYKYYCKYNIQKPYTVPGNYRLSSCHFDFLLQRRTRPRLILSIILKLIIFLCATPPPSPNLSYHSTSTPPWEV